LFQVFLSWELVGICSYLLIGFYYERRSASTAANKAFITNRVGDAGFILGLLILWTYFGTFNFEQIFAQVRSPLKDADDHLARAGQIVRADWDTSKGEPVLRVSKEGEGHEAVLFPVKPDLGGDHGTHFHGVDTVGQKVPLTASRTERDYGTMPYW